MNKELLVGARRINITPPLGVSMTGGFCDCKALEIADELFASAVIIDDGNTEIALISADVCAIPDAIYLDIATAIEIECSISTGNILLVATHTHTGPALGSTFSKVGEVCPYYVEVFKKNVVTAVSQAKSCKQPSKVGVGKGRFDKYIFNRRLKKPDASIVMNWVDKVLLQDCIDEGVIDPEVYVIEFIGSDANPIAFVINYANHNNAMCSDRAISSDWAGFMCRKVIDAFGKDTVALFLPGACGNVNWIDYKDFNQGYGPGLVEKIGAGLAEKVCEIASKLEYIDVDSIDILSKRIVIPDRTFREYDIKRDGTFGNIKEADFIFKQYEMEKALAAVNSLPLNDVRISVLRIGENISIATNPGELFTEFGIEIKEKSPFKNTLVSELVNGYAGYICSGKAFDEGGYEVRKTNKSSHLDISAGEIIVDISVRMLNSFYK